MLQVLYFKGESETGFAQNFPEKCSGSDKICVPVEDEEAILLNRHSENNGALDQFLSRMQSGKTSKYDEEKSMLNPDLMIRSPGNRAQSCLGRHRIRGLWHNLRIL